MRPGSAHETAEQRHGTPAELLDLGGMLAGAFARKRSDFDCRRSLGCLAPSDGKDAPPVSEGVTPIRLRDVQARALRCPQSLRAQIPIANARMDHCDQQIASGPIRKK